MYTTFCHEIYGLIRTSALAGTPLMRPFFGSDMVLLAELSLSGRIYVLPDTLFFSRSHTDQASLVSGEPEAKSDSSVAPQNPRLRFALPRKVRYPAALLALLFTVRMPVTSRLHCGLVLLKFGLQPKKWRGVYEDFQTAIKEHSRKNSASSSSSRVVRAS